jgi:hypothetical protein
VRGHTAVPRWEIGQSLLRERSRRRMLTPEPTASTTFSERWSILFPDEGSRCFFYVLVWRIYRVCRGRSHRCHWSRDVLRGSVRQSLRRVNGPARGNPALSLARLHENRLLANPRDGICFQIVESLNIAVRRANPLAVWLDEMKLAQMSCTETCTTPVKFRASPCILVQVSCAEMEAVGSLPTRCKYWLVIAFDRL